MSKRTPTMWVEIKHTDGKILVEVDRTRCTDDEWETWQRRIGAVQDAASKILFPKGGV